MEQCIFCRIVAKQVPADIVFESDDILAFRDINPIAPTHVLVIPKKHIPSLEDVGLEHAGLLERIMLTARDIARAEKVAQRGYRVAVNVGAEGGQVVPHLHFHVVGGRLLAAKCG